MSRTTSRLAWRIPVAKIVDMAVACLIDLATASNSLESACTDIVCCCIHKYAVEKKRSACELIATSLRALFSHISKFLIGMEHFPCWKDPTGKLPIPMEEYCLLERMDCDSCSI